MPDDLIPVSYRPPGEPRDWETLRSDAIRAVLESLGNWAHADEGLAATVTDAVLAVVDDETVRILGEQLIAETRLKSMDFRNGAHMDIEPAREMVAAWVGAARAMLGDALNYSETRMEFKLAGELERYAFTVQKVGKLTPHEARRQAEAERDGFDTVLRKVRDQHQGDGADSPFCTECGHSWPCWTARAVNGGLDA